MNSVRKLEMALAAVIAGGAVFAAFAPGASSSDSGAGGASFNAPTPSFSVAEFQDVAVSDAARAVASAVAGSRTDAARFVIPAPANAADPGERQTRSPVQVTPRASAPSGPAWSGRTLGVEITAAPSGASSDANWWIVGGAGRESYAVAPGGLREFTIAPVAAETTIGDAHVGVGVRVSDRAFASIGYVREERKFVLGTQDWEEDEHYVGVGFQARW
jgi:hypothetical protein